jgi:hypothetical protein
MAQLKKWGKFQLVADPKLADLVFLLSADPYKGGNIIFASGQTGSTDDSHITEDPVPNYNKQSPTRYAYLTVIDLKTGDNLWSDKSTCGVVSSQAETVSGNALSGNWKTRLRNSQKPRPLWPSRATTQLSGYRVYQALPFD